MLKEKQKNKKARKHHSTVCLHTATHWVNASALHFGYCICTTHWVDAAKLHFGSMQLHYTLGDAAKQR